MEREPDSFRVSTWPRRTSVENSSPSRTTHSAAVAPPVMARATMSWAKVRRLVSSLVEDISEPFNANMVRGLSQLLESDQLLGILRLRLIFALGREDHTPL